MAIGWAELGALALARQFPEEPLGVAEAVRRIGPIQSQTARSPFLALAARFPGVTHEQVTAAYDDHAIVRGSTIRGTVHTTVPEHHPLLEVATRIGQRPHWSRTLRSTRSRSGPASRRSRTTSGARPTSCTGTCAPGPASTTATSPGWTPPPAATWASGTGG